MQAPDPYVFASYTRILAYVSVTGMCDVRNVGPPCGTCRWHKFGIGNPRNLEPLGIWTLAAVVGIAGKSKRTMVRGSQAPDPGISMSCTRIPAYVSATDMCDLRNGAAHPVPRRVR